MATTFSKAIDLGIGKAFAAPTPIHVQLGITVRHGEPGPETLLFTSPPDFEGEEVNLEITVEALRRALRLAS